MSFTVFGSTTPAVVNGNDSDDYALGTVVQIAEAGTITHARWHFPNPLPVGSVTWYCADLSTHDLLGSHTFTSPASGWVEQALASPIVIAAARNVLVWIGTPQAYVFTNGFFTSAATVSGPLTAPRSSNDPEGIGNGRFGGTPASYPAGTSGATSYFADLVFDNAPPGGSADFAFVATPIGIGSRASVPPNEGATALSFGVELAGTGAAVDPSPPPAVAHHGGWASLMGIIVGQRADAEQYRQRLRNPTECPIHFTQLDQNAAGVLHCTFGGHIVRRG